MGSILNRRAAWLACGLLFISLLAGGCGSGAGVVRSTRNFPQGTGFTKHRIVVDGQQRTVWVFVPKDYSPQRRYPAVLFLHGLFEAGNGSGANAVSAGLGPVIANDPQNWPFITIFPQSTGTWRGEARERVAIGALDFAQSRWSIDHDRVILAGLSYGGLGTWEIGAHNPGRFAALVPASGFSATDLVERIVTMPVWAFSYRNDPWVRSQNSADMCRQITQQGGVARLTSFDGMGHDCWDRAVGESQVVAWMLAQRRGGGAEPMAISTAERAVASVE
jgi:predicted peptidase